MERRKDYHSNRRGMLDSGGNPIFLVPLFLVNLASPTGTLGQESLRTCKNIHPPSCHKGSLLPCREFMSTPAGELHWPRAFLLPQRTQWLHPEAEDHRRTGSHLEGTGPSSWSEWLRLDSNISISPACNIPTCLPEEQSQFSQARVGEDPKTHVTPLVKRKMEKKFRHYD